MENVLAVVLGAGRASRYRGDGHKLLANFRGRPLAAWAVEHAVGAGLPTLVVEGAADLGSLATSYGAEVLENPRWEEGQATSLQVAVGEAARRGAGAVVVGLADQPFIPSTAWAAVAVAPGPLAVATYEGVRRHPVLLGAEVWSALPTTGDDGARHLLRASSGMVVEVACAGEPIDIDTVEELQRWS